LKLKSSKFNELMSSAKEDKMNFKEVISSLGLISQPNLYYPAYTNKQILSSTTKKYPRYIKDKENNNTKTPMFTDSSFFGATDQDPNKEVKILITEGVDKYVKGEINDKEFEKQMKRLNINSNVEEISKNIRAVNNGPSNKDHRNLLFSVLKYGERFV
jgi:hypothetical protein